MPCKKPGRFKRVCAQCKSPFSTHSTDRKKCHRCLPKCREIHAFHPVARKMFQAVQQPPVMTNVSSIPTAPPQAPTPAFPAAFA